MKVDSETSVCESVHWEQNIATCVVADLAATVVVASCERLRLNCRVAAPFASARAGLGRSTSAAARSGVATVRRNGLNDFMVSKC